MADMKKVYNDLIIINLYNLHNRKSVRDVFNIFPFSKTCMWPFTYCNFIMTKNWTNTANSKSDKSLGMYIFFVIFGNLDKGK